MGQLCHSNVLLGFDRRAYLEQFQSEELWESILIGAAMPCRGSSKVYCVGWLEFTQQLLASSSRHQLRSGIAAPE